MNQVTSICTSSLTQPAQRKRGFRVPESPSAVAYGSCGTIQTGSPGPRETSVARFRRDFAYSLLSLTTALPQSRPATASLSRPSDAAMAGPARAVSLRLRPLASATPATSAPLESQVDGVTPPTTSISMGVLPVHPSIRTNTALKWSGRRTVHRADGSTRHAATTARHGCPARRYGRFPSPI